jgi:Sec20
MILETLAVRTERIVSAPDEEEKNRRNALSVFRRAIEVAQAQNEDVSKYVNLLQELEAKFRSDISDHAMRRAATYASKRVELLSSKESRHRQEVLGRADLLVQSKDANESLVRTRDLLVKELSRVNDVNAVLLADSEKLRDVGGEYTAYDSTLKTSRGLLKNMQRREATDRILVGFGVAFFLFVVAYILKRRLMPLFSPIGWLLDQLASLAANSTATETSLKSDL